MRTRLSFLSLSILFLGTAFAQDGAVIAPERAALQDIAGTPALVTVVLKNGGARDLNLTIVGAYDGHFSVRDANNKQYAYTYAMVEEIIVQGAALDKKPFELSEYRTLREEHQQILDRAWQRTSEIYNEANALQGQKITAAALLVLNGDSEALTYLNKLADSNDLATQVTAGMSLYVAGEEIPVKLLRLGLASTDRPMRATTAMLAGYAGYQEGTPALEELFADRQAEYSVPAAQALTRLGNRDIIPQLLTMLSSQNIRKGEAAVYCLSRLGGDEILEQLNRSLINAEGAERYRIIRVLDNLGDPKAKDLMDQTFNELQLDLKDQFAIILARQGHAGASEFLRERLKRREDPTDASMLFRMHMVSALYGGGDTSTLALLQDLLRDGSPFIKIATYRQITVLGGRQFMTIIQSGIENTDPTIALAACTTAVSLADPNVRNRITALNEQK